MIDRINQLTKHFNQKILAFDPNAIDTNNNGILGGRLGLLYYFLNMYELTKEEIYITRISELLDFIFESCMDKTKSISSQISFSGGLSGLGFVLNKLIKAEILDDSYGEQISVINDLALEYSLKAIAENNFDFFYGSAGSLYYLCEMEKIDYCERIAEELFIVGSKNNFLFPSVNEDEFNRGINFGLAHGNTALFIILIKLVEKGLNNKNLLAIINKGIPALLKYESEEFIAGESTKTYFPHNILLENGKTTINRSKVLGWCNSELAIPLLIERYNEVLGNTDFLELSNKVGLETLKRKTADNTGVCDYHFCHGSSGIAQLYKKLYERTKVSEYDQAHTFWLSETVRFLEKEKDEVATESKINYLYGWPSALLALHSYANEQIGNWDSFYLI